MMYSDINRQHIVSQTSNRHSVIVYLSLFVSVLALTTAVFASLSKTFVRPRAVSDVSVANLTKPVLPEVLLTDSTKVDLRLVTTDLPEAVVGQTYRLPVVAESSSGTVTLLMPEFPGIPNWGGDCTKTFSTDNRYITTCFLSGVPQTAGNFNMKFNLSDESGKTVTTTLILRVFAAPASLPVSQ